MTAWNDAVEAGSHPLVKKVHHGAQKETARHKLGSLLESRWADIFILCVVMMDIGLLTVEHGIDSGLFCISGRRAPAEGYDPDALVAGEHGELPVQPLPGGLPGSSPMLPVRVPAGTAFVVPAGYDLALRPRKETSTASGEAPPGPHGPPQMIQPAVLPTPGDTAAAAASRIAAAYPGRVAVQSGGEGEEGGGGELPDAQEPETPSTHLLQTASQLGQLPVELREFQAEAGSRALRGENAPHGDSDAPEMVRVCEPREGHYSHLIEHWAHILSVALLGLMFFEILLKLWVHPGEFLRNPLEVLDLVVVGVSLFVDAILLPLLGDPIQKAHAEIFIAIMLLCRIWRVARILHGIVQVVMIQREHSHKLYERIKILEKKEGELEALQQELARDQIQGLGPDKGGRRRS